MVFLFPVRRKIRRMLAAKFGSWRFYRKPASASRNAWLRMWRERRCAGCDKPGPLIRVVSITAPIVRPWATSWASSTVREVSARTSQIYLGIPRNIRPPITKNSSTIYVCRNRERKSTIIVYTVLSIYIRFFFNSVYFRGIGRQVESQASDGIVVFSWVTQEERKPHKVAWMCMQTVGCTIIGTHMLVEYCRKCAVCMYQMSEFR